MASAKDDLSFFELRDTISQLNNTINSQNELIKSINITIANLNEQVEYLKKKLYGSVSGNGFLYNMVRIIAGTLLEVGRGTIKPDDITRIIESGDRSKAGPTAPACGLTLMEYRFT